MNKRVKIFVTTIIAIVLCLTMLVPVYAVSKRSCSTSKTSYSATGKVTAVNCHSGEVSTSAQVRCVVYPVTNPGAGTSYVYGSTSYGSLTASSTYSNSNYVVSSASHACRVYCDTCGSAVGSMSSFHS